MTVTSQDIVNQAIMLIGDDQPAVTGQAPNFDSSPAGVAASKLYFPCIQTILRQSNFDFSRNTQALELTGNAAPFPWAFEYSYPANCVQVWQLVPPTFADPNNPLPVNWDIANNVVNGAQSRVILTNLAGALAVFDNAPNENTWDALFRESVVRLLASELAMALAARPDSSQGLLQSGSAFETIADERSAG